MKYVTLLMMLLAACSIGCIPGTGGSANAPTPPAAPEPTAPPELPDEEPPQPATADVEPTAPPMERVVAEAGVGKKGQSLEGETGIVVEPVKQLIKFEQKAIFDLQIKPALELYKASNGSYPKTHEEFMSKIIKANNIPLPPLPEGQQYVFDSEAGQLMVERPKQ